MNVQMNEHPRERWRFTGRFVDLHGGVYFEWTRDGDGAEVSRPLSALMGDGHE